MVQIFNRERGFDFFHTLFDHAAASMAVVLADGTMLMFNQNFCRFVGYTESELLQLNVLDITLPEDRELTAARFREGREKKSTSFQYEKRYLRKDGKVVWGLISGCWITEEPATYGVALIQDITARRESERALRESEELYRTLVENIDLGITLIDEDRRILKVNSAFSRLMDKPAEAFAGRECFREFEKREKVCEHCPGTESLETGKPATVITEGVRDDGSRAVMRLHTFPVPDGDGRVRKFVEVVEDITDGVEVRDALRESEARYRRLFETNPYPMWIFDLQTLEFLAVNDAAVAHYGYSREEFLGMTIKEIRPPEGVPKLLEALALSSDDGGQHWSCHRCKDGRLIEVEIHAHSVDFNGRKARVVLAHDVTESRRVQERMKLDAAALMSTRDAVLITDRTPVILSVNPAFTEMTGYSETEILGKPPSLLSSSRHDPAFFKDIWTDLLKDNLWQGEFWGRRQDGETFPGWLTLSTVHNDEGRPTHFVGVITDLTKLRRSEEKLQYLANYDALTDLPKRHLLESILQHALERARREKGRLGLLVLDLDQFKAVNDSFGHRAGDELLLSFVQRLRGQVRSEDTLSRLAGDQFALVLEGIQDYSDLEGVARHLQSLLTAPFTLGDGHRVYLRASVGISVFPQDGASAQDLLRGADAAVYLAKERGGNQFCYCTAELNTQARLRLEIQSELQQALEKGEFVLHYQPKVDLRSGRIIGAEALLRWNSPTRGMVPPLQFIPVAEKSGLIVPLGAWVIENVCRQIHMWREAGLENVSVSVNVSARQFRSGKLEDLVAAALRQYGLDPQTLMIELTESMLMDAEEAIHRIVELRRVGIRISLDDFGTGYSSLGYLGRFPIDQLKIDRSFITDIVTDPNSATIATSVIAMAHRMRLKVVAEGVETEEQLGYLRQNGCDEMQGFYFSRPVSADDFAELIRQGKTLPPLERTSGTPTLLIVDDEPRILSAIRRLLSDDGYRILTAGSAREGLDLLARHAVQVIITDQRMPEMSGTEFLRRVKVLHPNTVRLILSGYADLATVTESVNEGALYKFLSKPWDDEQIREQVRDAFCFYETTINPRSKPH